jgi:hypothetical protein
VSEATLMQRVGVALLAIPICLLCVALRVIEKAFDGFYSEIGFWRRELPRCWRFVRYGE